MRLLFKIAYDGRNYSGWQRQPNAPTIQQTIEEALSIITRDSITITGCGRTDAGVHASCYYFHADIDDLSYCLDDLVYKLNSLLPNDIVVYNVESINDDISARYNATSRSYKYHLHTVADPFIKDYSFFYPHVDNVEQDKIEKFISFILSQKRFKPFCKTNSDVSHYNCEIMDIQWRQITEHRYVLEIKANRFLRGMIRLLVGAMLNYSRGKVTIEELEDAFENQRQLTLNWSVPGHGLFLSDISYSGTLNT